MADYGMSLKSEGVPISVLAELWSSVPEGMGRKHAIAFLLQADEPQPEDEEVAHMQGGWRPRWIKKLRQRIMAGQLRLAEFREAELGVLSTHVPQEMVETVREAARGIGIESLSQAVKLILIGLSGRLGETLLAAAPPADGEADESLS